MNIPHTTPTIPGSDTDIELQNYFTRKKQQMYAQYPESAPANPIKEINELISRMNLGTNTYTSISNHNITLPQTDPFSSSKEQGTGSDGLMFMGGVLLTYAITKIFSR